MLKNRIIEDFVTDLASSSPSPGGGAVSALLGALSTALCSMMANLTVGKKGYEKVWETSQDVVEKMTQLRAELYVLMDEDARSFDAVMNALKLPKETEEEKALRSEEIQKGYLEAIRIPLAMAEKTMSLFEPIEFIVLNGNRNVITDGIAAAMSANCAINMALLNVKINLKSVKDQAYAKKTLSKVIDLEVASASRLAKICSRSGLQF